MTQCAADRKRVSGRRGAKRSEPSTVPWRRGRNPRSTRPARGRSRRQRPRHGRASLGRGTPKSFSYSPRGIREPDCETYMSSRSEVLVIWRWWVDEPHVGKRYSGDNRLILPKSSHRRQGLAPRCRLIASWGWSRSQGFGCSPIKAVRELGSERRETVRSLSAMGVGCLRGAVPSTRGPEWTNLWCASYRGHGTPWHSLPRVGAG